VNALVFFKGRSLDIAHLQKKPGEPFAPAISGIMKMGGWGGASFQK
jgi:hypothetical protein